MSTLSVRGAESCRWDLVSLGEVMLRLDPGDVRIHTARSFRVWEGGGEYNVARGLRRCFGRRTAIATALADNPVGRLLEDLMLQGGVDTSLVRWVPYDGVGREVRNGLNFTERGFGPRAALGCSDRGHTAASKLSVRDLPWRRIFAEQGARWFHTGGIFCALSASTPLVALEAIEAARAEGTVVSYDCNYRRSLAEHASSEAIVRELLAGVDVLFAGVADMHHLLGARTAEAREGFGEACVRLATRYPRLRYVASTERIVHSASLNGWGARCYDARSGEVLELPPTDLQVFDRVGGGDSFASGFIHGLLEGHDPLLALRYGVAHGALAMSTPGDSTMATYREVRSLMGGESARIER